MKAQTVHEVRIYIYPQPRVILINAPGLLNLVSNFQKAVTPGSVVIRLVLFRTVKMGIQQVFESLIGHDSDIVFLSGRVMLFVVIAGKHEEAVDITRHDEAAFGSLCVGHCGIFAVETADHSEIVCAHFPVMPRAVIRIAEERSVVFPGHRYSKYSPL